MEPKKRLKRGASDGKHGKHGKRRKEEKATKSEGQGDRMRAWCVCSYEQCLRSVPRKTETETETNSLYWCAVYVLMQREAERKRSGENERREAARGVVSQSKLSTENTALVIAAVVCWYHPGQCCSYVRRGGVYERAGMHTAN